MSVVTVQLGQCGNQIGYNLNSVIFNECVDQVKKRYADFNEVCSDMFFESYVSKDNNLLHRARSVLVDSEHKVISKVVERSKLQKWCYDPNSQVSLTRGSGNNWAHGYHGYGPKIESLFEDVMRRKVEGCDRLSGFLMLMSLAGGTGSGVGSYLAEYLKDHYHHSLLVNQVVWPYYSGEVAVQNLNAVLSLAHIHQSSDAIIAFDNDSLHKICTSQLSIKKVSFLHVNEVLSKQLCSSLLPTGSLNPDPLNDLATHLTPHPQFKVISTSMAPMVSCDTLHFTTYHWPAILKNLQHINALKFDPNKFDAEWQLKYSLETKKEKSFAHLLICRGSGSCELNKSDLKNQYFKPIDRFPAFNPNGFSVRTHSKHFCGMDKSAVLLSNDCSQMLQINRVIDKAWDMFTSKAFLHQYKKYGVEEDDFVDCFVTLEQILCSYANL